MTVIKLIICIMFALLLLAGCSPQNRDAAPIPTEEIVENAAFESAEIDEMIAEQIEEAAETPDEETDANEAERAAALEALLEDVRTSVFPGTAGSSLTAAAHAAQMADFFAAADVGADEVDAAARAYIASLSDEDAQLFEMQLDAVVSAFSNLRGENGAGLLSDCGYESTDFPWDGENVRDCFIALLGTD